MRIIAGVAKGRNLASIAGSTRPTSDRAREALFSSLISEFGGFDDLKFLDLFAGSGAVGLEALSRGAQLVHAVEKDESAQKTIKANLEIVKRANPVGKFHAYSMSAQKFLESDQKNSYDIIFIDPPYDFGDQGVREILMAIAELKVCRAGGLIVVERSSKSQPITWPEPIRALRSKEYGVATLHYAEMG